MKLRTKCQYPFTSQERPEDSSTFYDEKAQTVYRWINLVGIVVISFLIGAFVALCIIT